MCNQIRIDIQSLFSGNSEYERNFVSVETNLLHIACVGASVSVILGKRDHGLFVGYAPYEEPEIAMAIRITNGYSSAFAAELGCEMTRYYFKLASPKTLLHGSASTNLSSSHGD